MSDLHPHQRASAEHRDPQSPDCNKCVSFYGRQPRRCGSNPSQRHPEPNRLCDLACSRRGASPRAGFASTEMLPAGGRHHVHRDRIMSTADPQTAGIMSTATGSCLPWTRRRPASCPPRPARRPASCPPRPVRAPQSVVLSLARSSRTRRWLSSPLERVERFMAGTATPGSCRIERWRPPEQRGDRIQFELTLCRTPSAPNTTPQHVRQL
jgi:hypothetical protein